MMANLKCVMKYHLGKAVLQGKGVTPTFQRRFYQSRNILKLHERGIWADRFPDTNIAINHLLEELRRHRVTVYSGFDPTADSLHVGNLLVMMAMLHCQRAGHNVIALVGGATGQVGDPSGKSKERPLLSQDFIENNSKALIENLTRIFDNHSKLFWDDKNRSEPLSTLRIVNNETWYNDVSVIEFLRDAGRHCRLGAMLGRTSVQSRLNTDEGMSFTEFTYQILQAYDWMHLFDQYDCTIQIGGSDQMGNIVSGHDLISKARNKQVTGLTVPLITTASGNKFGKSAGNAIWLNATKTSPFDFYQFFLRIADDEVEKFLCLFTFYPVSDIKKIMEKHTEKPETRSAQKKLAEKVTLLVHGREGLKTALRTTSALYGNLPEALAELSSKELIEVFKGATQTSLLLQPGTTILKMALEANCFSREVDARRLIEAGGFYVNHARVNNPDLVLIPEVHILNNGITLARVGKKNYYLVKWLT